MNRAVMISIRPEWVEKILSGEKTLEVRKRAPKLPTPFKCYIYCSKPKNERDGRRFWSDGLMCGYVVGEFTVKAIRHIPPDLPDPEDWKDAGMSVQQLIVYSDGMPCFGLEISKLKEYEKPKELNDFMQCHRCGEYCTCLKEPQLCRDEHKLRQPPQSWCYVDEVTI